MKKKIFFYINIYNKFYFICKLIKKLILLKKKIFLYSNNYYELNYLNNFLWIFNKKYFIPHIYINLKFLKFSKLLLINNINYYNKKYFLINLSKKYNKITKNFKKIFEIISKNNKLIIKKKKFYKKNNFKIYKFIY